MGAKKENGHAAAASADEKKNVKDAGDAKPVASSKVVRLPKPDRSGVDAQIAALNDSIEAQQLRITEVRQAIESKRGNRKSMNGDVQNVRNELVQVRTEFKRELVRFNNKHKMMIIASRYYLKVTDAPRLHRECTTPLAPRSSYLTSLVAPTLRYHHA